MIVKQFEKNLWGIQVVACVSGCVGFSFEVVNLEDHQHKYKETHSLIVSIFQLHYYRRKFYSNTFFHLFIQDQLLLTTEEFVCLQSLSQLKQNTQDVACEILFQDTTSLGKLDAVRMFGKKGFGFSKRICKKEKESIHFSLHIQV